MKTEILHINRNKPEISKLKKAVEVLKNGGVIVIPTDTVYGLAANAFNSNAQKKIYRLKSRSYDKPLILMPPDLKSLGCLAEIPADARKLVKKFWPGSLTIVLPAKTLGRMIMGGRSDLGARIPDNKVILGLLSLCDFPMLTTSANPSSKPSATNAVEARKYFNNKVNLILDAGKSRLGRESTVIDMAHFPYVVIREGCLPGKELIRYL